MKIFKKIYAYLSHNIYDIIYGGIYGGAFGYAAGQMNMTNIKDGLLFGAFFVIIIGVSYGLCSENFRTKVSAAQFRTIGAVIFALVTTIYKYWIGF